MEAFADTPWSSDAMRLFGAARRLPPHPDPLMRNGPSPGGNGHEVVAVNAAS
jgi:hypothetical protein